MSSPVADLEAGLQAMLTLKPPGVTGSRINSLTTLCLENVSSESILIQKLYTHFRKAPGTHKLGVLYVVDSVARKWSEHARKTGQAIESSAPDGTFAAGVYRISELLPALMNDIIQSAPHAQKEKMLKLVDIWEKGSTFPLPMLTSFKEKLGVNAANQSTTPPGSPPVDLQRTMINQPQAPNPAVPAPPSAASILASLSNMARQNKQQPAAIPQPSVPAFQPQDNQYNVSNTQSNPVPQAAVLNPSLPYLPVQAPVNMPATHAALAQQNNGAQNYASNPNNPYPGVAPLAAPSGLSPALQQQLLVAKALAESGMPHDQIVALITSMSAQGGLGGATSNAPAPQPYAAQGQSAAAQNPWGARTEESRDIGFQDGTRSPQSRYRRRSRSPSPVHGGWNNRDSGNRRRDEGQDFDRDGGRSGRGRGGRNDFRQRSPQRRSSTPPPQGGGEKWIQWDDKIGQGNIKVLSRTLFVGGVNCSEYDLRRLFEPYGRVQTCIVNKEKRHAFVKMMSRLDAVAAKDGMEKNRTPDSHLRTRWGVGFGPRDCSDYTTGISIIPITKLTDADRKWMLTAEFGGSGGIPIEGGMVVEEPDIEIGQGVSSKAISRRMQTDQGGKSGPKSSHHRDEDEHGRSRRSGRDRDDRRDEDRNDRFPAVSGPPAMPAIPPFGMGMGNFSNFPMPTFHNGAPMMLPGFTFPGQPAAPGQSSTSSAPGRS